MNPIIRTPNDVGHAIRRARRLQGLTQQELATKSGIWQETISRIENGSTGTRLETLFDLCAALELELQMSNRSKGTTDFLEQDVTRQDSAKG